MLVQKPKQGYKLVKSLFGKYEEIPEGWEELTLHSLSKSFTKQTGFDYTAHIKPKLITAFKQGVLPFIQNKDFQEKKINFDTDYYIPEDVANNFPRILLDEKCLLISISGNIGNVGIFSNLQKAFCGAAIAVVKFRDKEPLDWVMYYLLSNIGQQKLLKDVKVGSHHNLILDDIRKIKITLPPLNEQQKIASILSNIDSLIQLTQKAIEQTQRLKKGLMLQLYTKGISHKKFKKISIVPKFVEFVIPEEWTYNTLDSLSSEIKDGPMGFSLHNYDYVEEGIPILKVQNLQNLTVTKKDMSCISKEKHEELKKSQVKPLDIIISKTGIYLGVIGIVPKDYGPANLNQALARICLKDKNNVTFIAKFLAHGLPQRILNLVGSSRTAQPGLRLSDIKNLLIPIPSKEEQQKIDSILSNVDLQIEKQQEHKSKLENLKKGLMQKLLTGQIRVKI